MSDSLFEKANEIVEAVGPSVGFLEAMKDAGVIGCILVHEKGGPLGYDFQGHHESPVSVEEELELEDAEGFLLAEAVMLSQLIAFREGFARIGVEIPDANTYLIAATGRQK